MRTKTRKRRNTVTITPIIRYFEEEGLECHIQLNNALHKNGKSKDLTISLVHPRQLLEVQVLLYI
jgi:hypothetical protein